jgi:Ca2+-binding RTX toxin-like protein
MNCLESLERRRLLAVTFALSDISGSYYLYGGDIAGGTIRFDGAGKITGGSLNDPLGHSIRVTSGNYSVSANGSVSGTVKTSDDPTIRFSGALSSNKQLLLVNSAGDDLDPTLLIRSGSAPSSSQVAGKWRGASNKWVELDSRGHIVRGTIDGNLFGIDEDGTVISGSYQIGGSGSVSGSIRVDAGSYGQHTLKLSGAVNRAGDVAAMHLVLADDPSLWATLVVAHSGSSHKAADIVGSWSLAGYGSQGTVNFDGKGHVTGGVITEAGGSSTVSGSYSVQSNGTVNATLSFSGRRGGTGNYTATLNRAKNLLVVVDDSYASDEEGGFMLVRADGAFARLSGNSLTVAGTAAADVTGISVRSGKLYVTQNSVTQKFTASSVSRLLVQAGKGDDKVSLGGGVIGATLDGGDGDDTLVGGAGSDSLLGGNGADSLVGSGGNDTLNGSVGADRLFGSAGNDLLRARDSIIDLVDGGGGTDRAKVDAFDSLSGVESLLS